MKCTRKMQGIKAENVLLLAFRGALVQLFELYLLTFPAVSQLLFLPKGSGVRNLMICLPANRSFITGGNDRTARGQGAGRVVLGHGVLGVQSSGAWQDLVLTVG